MLRCRVLAIVHVHALNEYANAIRKTFDVLINVIMSLQKKATP